MIPDIMDASELISQLLIFSKRHSLKKRDRGASSERFKSSAEHGEMEQSIAEPIDSMPAAEMYTTGAEYGISVRINAREHSSAILHF